MSTITNYMSVGESPNDNQQTITCGGVDFNFAKFTIDEARSSTVEVDNVINVVLGLIGLSVDDPPTGDLDGLDVHNFNAVDALRVALMEGIRDNILYDLILDEEGNPLLYTIDVEEAGSIDTWIVTTTDVDKPPPAIVVRGNDPLPYMELKDPINLISNGEGPEVDVISLGAFEYEECGGKLYNYYGSISYKDPNFNITSKSDIEHALTLKSYESLVGVIYMFTKPDDVDVNFSDTTPIEVKAYLATGYESDDVIEPFSGLSGYNIAVEAEYDKVIAGEFYQENQCDTECIRLEPDHFISIFSTDYTILGVDQVTMRGSKFIGINFNVSEDDNLCETSQGSSEAVSTYTCSDMRTDTSYFKLNIGTDFFYTVEDTVGVGSAYSKAKKQRHESLGGSRYLFSAAVPYRLTDIIFRMTGSEVSPDIYMEYHLVDFPNSINTVILPASVSILLNIDKPSIHITKKTLDPTGVYAGEVSRTYKEELEDIASQISLCAVPVVNVNLPPPVAYAVDDSTILLDQEACTLDSDPTTVQDTINTPCEKMSSDLNGKAVVDLTLPFLNEAETVEACSFLFDKANSDYNEGSAVVDGMTVSASDLGKKYNGGVINRISWNYQDSSSFRASISYGSPLASLSSGNLSMYKQATDSALTREGTVVSDIGNGYEYMVSIKGLGVYKAVTMMLADIRVGDTVNVTIYNNIAEARF